MRQPIALRPDYEYTGLSGYNVRSTIAANQTVDLPMLQRAGGDAVGSS
jgi:hypothetical protein